MREIPKPSNDWSNAFKVKDYIPRAKLTQVESDLRSEGQWREHHLSGTRKYWKLLSKRNAEATERRLAVQ